MSTGRDEEVIHHFCLLSTPHYDAAPMVNLYSPALLPDQQSGFFTSTSLLELSSTTKGFVLPRMTKAQRNAIAFPVAGMVIYQTDNTPGLRVFNGTNWMRFTETAD